MSLSARAAVIVTVSGLVLAAFGCAKPREAPLPGGHPGAAGLTPPTEEGAVEVQTNEGDSGAPISDSNTSETGAVGGVDLAKLGLEVYPGATEEGSTDVTGAMGGLVGLNLTTEDSYDKVARFYKKKYATAVLRESLSRNQKIMRLQIGEPPDIKTVTVMKRKAADRVAITLMRHRTSE